MLAVAVINVNAQNPAATNRFVQTGDEDPEPFGMRWAAMNSFPKKHYLVYDSNDVGNVYKENVNPQNCIFVISKRDFRIYVYEDTSNGRELVAHFPVCLARNIGDKFRSGDGTTPVCVKDRNGNYIPFTISQIQPASSWRHDFKDGRGNILAYGDWFMRLQLNSHRVASNRSIGIHGSSSNAISVPGRASEGCIRLRNNDLNMLRQYARVGTKVIIKPEDAKKLPWELEAQRKLGNRYKRPQQGFVLPEGGMWVNK